MENEHLHDTSSRTTRVTNHEVYMAVKSNHQALFRCTLLSTEADHGETTSHIGVELNQFAALALGADGFLVTHISQNHISNTEIK